MKTTYNNIVLKHSKHLYKLKIMLTYLTLLEQHLNASWLKWTLGQANILGNINSLSGPHKASGFTAHIYNKQHCTLHHFKYSTNKKSS